MTFETKGLKDNIQGFKGLFVTYTRKMCSQIKSNMVC